MEPDGRREVAGHGDPAGQAGGGVRVLLDAGSMVAARWGSAEGE